MHRFFSLLAIFLVLANLVKTLAFQITPLSSIRLGTTVNTSRQSKKIGKPSRSTFMTRSDTGISILHYKNKVFEDGSEDTATNVNVDFEATTQTEASAVASPAPKKKKSRVTRVIRSTSSESTNKVKVAITLEEFEKLREESVAENRLMIVRFFSHWCKSCKAVEPMYRRLARKNPQVSFVDIPISKENEELRDVLNIVSVPFGHIYHPTAGLMEELQMGKRFWNDFQDIFYRYTKGVCEVLDDFEYSDPLVKRQKINF